MHGVGRTIASTCVALLAFPTFILGQGTDPLCRSLVSDASSSVGEVCVSLTASEVEIVITSSGGYRLVESRAAVAGTLEGLPLSESGIPRLGLFPYAGTHLPPSDRASYRVPRSDLDLTSREVVVSVQASVLDAQDVEHGAWSEGTRFRPQGMPATYFVVPIQE